MATVVFITGIGKGIGKGLAQIYLSRPDCTVIGSVRDKTAPGVAELKAQAKANGTTLLLVHIDSTSTTDPASALAAVQDAGIKHIDVLIANAGGYPPVVPLETVGRGDLMSCFEVNAAAPLLLFQTFAPLLRAARAPKLAVISTQAGSIASVTQLGSHIMPAYGASKAALNWLIRAIHNSQEWLTTIAVHPGLVQTDQGNWVARTVGLGQEAPTTVADSAASIVALVDGATREDTSGKFINTVEGMELPW